MSRPSIRKYHVARALESVVSLREIINELSENEVMHCLQLESASQRRKAIIATLITHAARLNKRAFIKQLTEKYDATSTIEDSGNRSHKSE